MTDALPLRPEQDDSRLLRFKGVSPTKYAMTLAGFALWIVPRQATAEERPRGAWEGRHPWFIASVNPLPIFESVASAQVEVLPIAHVGFIVNGSTAFMHTTNEGLFSTTTRELHGWGLETGIRGYAFGGPSTQVFVGTSLLHGRYSYEAWDPYACCDRSTTVYSRYGLAFETGFVTVLSGFTIEVGGGVSVAKLDHEPDFESGGGFRLFPPIEKLFAGGGVAPRFLLALGYAL